MNITYDFRIKQIERFGVECFVAALIINGSIAAHTTVMSEAAAKTWILDKKQFIARMDRAFYC